MAEHKEKPTAAEIEMEQKAKELAEKELELKNLEITAKKLEVLEKEANLQDLQERLQERELKRNDKGQRSKTNGQTLKQNAQATEATQKRCNHKKGGNGANGVIGGQGDDSQYSVLKHVMANGDMWIRCLRCGKTWKPVLPDWFKTVEEYTDALVEYKTAVQFQTRNSTSSSVPFRFSDGGVHFKEVTRSVTL